MHIGTEIKTKANTIRVLLDLLHLMQKMGGRHRSHWSSLFQDESSQLESTRKYLWCSTFFPISTKLCSPLKVHFYWSPCLSVSKAQHASDALVSEVAPLKKLKAAEGPGSTLKCTHVIWQTPSVTSLWQRSETLTDKLFFSKSFFFPFLNSKIKILKSY